MDHYDGESGRDRSRGSERDREPKEYGRLNSDPEWNNARGRGGRSPGARRTRGRSRSPAPASIDRYVPGDSPRARRSRSPAPRVPRYDNYGHQPPGPQMARPSNIDRYVPGQGYSNGPGHIADPHKLQMSVTFNYFADWYRQEYGKNGAEVTKDDIQAGYDAYKEQMNGKLAKDFVAQHKNDEWFKERYEPEQKNLTKRKIKSFQRTAYRKWKILLEVGGFDSVDRETKSINSKPENGTDGEAIEEINRGVDDGGMKPVLLIKTISPTVSRVQLEELAQENLENFYYVSLSDPNPLKKFHRIGFILLKPTDPDDPTSECATPDQSTVDLLNAKSIHDDNHGDFVCHVGIHNGPNNPRQKKVLNEYMSAPENLKKEADLIERCISKLEGELALEDEDAMAESYDGWELIKDKVEEWGNVEREKRATSEEEGEEGADSEVELKILKKKIDLGVEYLRRVFNFCLYCVSSSDSIHELTRKCPGGHIRRPTPHIDYSADQRTVNWTKNWREKLELFIDPPTPETPDYAARITKIGGKPVPEAVNEECLKFVKQEDEGKYRCRVEDCTKLFKAEEFWRKHLDKKHPNWLRALERNAVLLNAYVSDPTRVHPPKVEKDAQGNFQTSGMPGSRNMPSVLPMNFNLGIPGFNSPAGLPTLNTAFTFVQNGNGLAAGGVGPIRRRDTRGGGTAGAMPVRDPRYGQPYVRRDRAEREREREKRDREMREAQARPGRAGSGAGPEMELAVLGRAVKSYKDLDATETKKAAEDMLDY